MNKRYQTNEIDTSMPAVPEQVSVAMDEIAADMREGLLALAVGAGLQVMGQLMEADVAAVCGARGKHDPERAASRHGTEAGSVTLGGRRVPVRRPRVCTADGTGEVPVPAYELFNSTELLAKMTMERMLGGLSTRRYPVGLEPVGEAVTASSRSRSKSAVSRKFVAMTEHALGDLLAADLSELDLVALMIVRRQRQHRTAHSPRHRRSHRLHIPRFGFRGPGRVRTGVIHHRRRSRDQPLTALGGHLDPTPSSLTHRRPPKSPPASGTTPDPKGPDATRRRDGTPTPSQ